MSIVEQRPDPNTVSHEAVARVARQRAATLVEDLILRDAKIAEQQQYIEALEGRVRELEGAAKSAPPARSADAVRAAG